jgi:hypothetical protein
MMLATTKVEDFDQFLKIFTTKGAISASLSRRYSAASSAPNTRMRRDAALTLARRISISTRGFTAWRAWGGMAA